jgi:hypothetical protein
MKLFFARFQNKMHFNWWGMLFAAISYAFGGDWVSGSRVICVWIRGKIDENIFLSRPPTAITFWVWKRISQINWYIRVFGDAEVSGMVVLVKRSVVAFSIGGFSREIFAIKGFVDIRARKFFLCAKSFVPTWSFSFRGKITRWGFSEFYEWKWVIWARKLSGEAIWSVRKTLRAVRVSFEQKSNSRSRELTIGDFDLAKYPSINYRLLSAILSSNRDGHEALAKHKP